MQPKGQAKCLLIVECSLSLFFKCKSNVRVVRGGLKNVPLIQAVAAAGVGVVATMAAVAGAKAACKKRATRKMEEAMEETTNDAEEKMPGDNVV